MAGDLAGGVRAVLLVLGRNSPQTVPEIARTRCTSRQNIQIVVNRLKEEGLLELVSNPTHKRSALVQLTAKGQAAFHQIEMAETRLLSHLLVDLSQDELISATKCLEKVRHALTKECQPSDSDSPQTEPLIIAPVRTMKMTKAKHPHSKSETSASDDDSFPFNLL
jgi:DNA-binding MarR family transcriptional regulator